MLQSLKRKMVNKPHDQDLKNGFVRLLPEVHLYHVLPEVLNSMSDRKNYHRQNKGLINYIDTVAKCRHLKN
jgi:hypothetical protein